MMLAADQPAGAAAGNRVAHSGRARVKQALTLKQPAEPAQGATLLIYHRIGAGTDDELDVPAAVFARQLEQLEAHDVLSLDAALDRLDSHDTHPSVVLTFDDGFEDVHSHAWPLLRERRLPFTVYLASNYVAGPMTWEGSTANGSRGRGMSWAQLEEMVDSGLCTLGNHTHRHVGPERLTVDELDECTEAIRGNIGVAPQHFAYPWGVPVPAMEASLRARFRSACTGRIGRNLPHTDRIRLTRVPVRQSDPTGFFAAKLRGTLGPERAYDRLVRLGKAVGLRG